MMPVFIFRLASCPLNPSKLSSSLGWFKPSSGFLVLYLLVQPSILFKNIFQTSGIWITIFILIIFHNHTKVLPTAKMSRECGQFIFLVRFIAEYSVLLENHDNLKPSWSRYLLFCPEATLQDLQFCCTKPKSPIQASIYALNLKNSAILAPQAFRETYHFAQVWWVMPDSTFQTGVVL